MIAFGLCRIAILALVCLMAPDIAVAGGSDSAADPAPSVPALAPDPEAASPSDSDDAAEICDCGARSPGALAETQRQMQESQTEQAP